MWIRVHTLYPSIPILFIYNVISRWEKAVGDSVSVDEILCEVETDKTSVPVPSTVSGVVEELLVEDGTTVTPGNSGKMTVTAAKGR